MGGSVLKALIEKIVKEELEIIAGEINSIVGQTIKLSLVSGIRELVKKAISETIDEISADSPEHKFMIFNRDTEADSSLSEEAFMNLRLTKEDENPPLPPFVKGGVGGLRRFSEETTGEGDNRGMYLYCIVESSDTLSLGRIGIEGNEVYTIPYNDLAAVVHNCHSEPYSSEDSEIVKGWVMVHQEVLDRALKEFRIVIPLGFDTIIKGVNGQTPEQNLTEWLKGEYENVKRKMARLKGKDEYGVQVFWEPKTIMQKIAQTDPEIKKLEEDIKSKPKGMAYMYKQKLEGALKTRLEKEADCYFKEFYKQIKSLADDLRIEKTKKDNDTKQMLINLSCLVDREKYKKLGEELEKINLIAGFFVRFTGPWPPYSFV